MEVQILKQVYKTAIRKNKFLKEQLAAINTVSTWTVDKWRWRNDPMLTTATNLTIIRNFLKLPADEVLTEPLEVIPEKSDVEEHVSVV